MLWPSTRATCMMNVTTIVAYSADDSSTLSQATSSAEIRFIKFLVFPRRQSRESSNPPIFQSTNSVQSKRPQHVARTDQQVLFAVNRVRLRRVADVAHARVPERLAVLCVVRDQVAAAITAEEQSA